ncbi:flavodoxin family protein [Acetonema longum]|uniref:Multimeric flavodoxin domain-containing protein n=1 Tax=Acetonema longum DSM 6540 TaxID=1009370 RepID=F7NKG1_9FIRM|nr:flavodoxin family protein [Acetonema longum]EGO63602.1 multimeric flavodoxin domain-containing protein [Acetonema longum DSM 6540]
MMTIIAVNGSPRKNWNTGILLQKALDGAAAAGAQTELVHLYDLSYKGCTGCLACKRKKGASLGRCAIRDDLQPVLERIGECDGLILGSPIYFSEVTGEMRSFLERLLFQYLSYDQERVARTPRPIPSAFIYTMNVQEAMLTNIGYTARLEGYKSLLERVLLSPSRSLAVTETLQTEDYSKYHMSMFDEVQRRSRRQEIFPVDCEKAYALGAALTAR